MIEVYSNLFVGGERHIFDFSDEVQRRLEAAGGRDKSGHDYYIIHAAKEPYHRQELGYTTRGAPKDNPEYLFARRAQKLVLNLVDVDVPKARFIPDAILDEAIEYLRVCCHKKHKPVFIHCNQGKSRAPSIALMFLMKHAFFCDGLSSFEEVEAKFKRIYPDYEPNGIRVKSRERFNAVIV